MDDPASLSSHFGYAPFHDPATVDELTADYRVWRTEALRWHLHGFQAIVTYNQKRVDAIARVLQER